MKIVLFGGAFDPPHYGHMAVTDYLLRTAKADEVWYVPVGVHDFQKQMTEAEHRVAMLGLILRPKTKIEKCELKRPGINHSFDTLEELSKKYPQHQFSFVIGADNLADFHKWYRYQDLLAKYPVYVYPRKGLKLEPLYVGMISLLGVEEVAVASTDIRQKMRTREDISELVTPEVNNYIRQNYLYA